MQTIIHTNATILGNASAESVTKRIARLLKQKETIRLILATGTSQLSFLKSLQTQQIEWSRILVFHLDEYVGLSDKHPASFRNYLYTRILRKVKPKVIHYLNADEMDLERVCQDYTKLLSEAPVDIACVGIGENGHLAFNDPHEANFEDPFAVKKVTLDQDCRNQQFDEGWFEALDQVPKEALTLTIPAIMKAEYISCVVPENRKAKAVYDTIHGPISTECPASILRTHPQVDLHLDQESASLL